ncbi:unnamed protein product, partial [Effrenium voratum]
MRTDEPAEMLVLPIGYSTPTKKNALQDGQSPASTLARSDTANSLDTTPAVKRKLSFDTPLQHSESRGSLEECLEQQLLEEPSPAEKMPEKLEPKPSPEQKSPEELEPKPSPEQKSPEPKCEAKPLPKAGSLSIQGNSADDRFRITYEARQLIYGLCNPDEPPSGDVGKGLLVVPGQWARLQQGARAILREQGELVRQVRSKLVSLRQEHQALKTAQKEAWKVGPLEIVRSVVHAQWQMSEKNCEDQWVLAAAVRNGILAYTPNTQTGKLAIVTEQHWAKKAGFQMGSKRFPPEWLRDRLKWLEADGKPKKADWSLSRSASAISDLVRWDYYNPEEDKEAEVDAEPDIQDELAPEL